MYININTKQEIWTYGWSRIGNPGSTKTTPTSTATHTTPCVRTQEGAIDFDIRTKRISATMTALQPGRATSQAPTLAQRFPSATAREACRMLFAKVGHMAEYKKYDRQRDPL
jgi:hypothetical protein